MIFSSAEELVAAAAPAARVDGDTIAIVGNPAPELIDRLAHTSALGSTPDIKGAARWIIRSLAAARGVRPASIHELYIAMGKGQAGGFTGPQPEYDPLCGSLRFSGDRGCPRAGDDDPAPRSRGPI